MLGIGDKQCPPGWLVLEECYMLLFHGFHSKLTASRRKYGLRILETILLVFFHAVSVSLWHCLELKCFWFWVFFLVWFGLVLLVCFLFFVFFFVLLLFPSFSRDEALYEDDFHSVNLCIFYWVLLQDSFLLEMNHSWSWY